MFGVDFSLSLQLIYTPPVPCDTFCLKKQVLQRQAATRQALERVQWNTTAQQLRRNAFFNHENHGPVYREGFTISLNAQLPNRVKVPFIQSMERSLSNHQIHQRQKLQSRRNHHRQRTCFSVRPT